MLSWQKPILVPSKPILIATRGSALALAQSNKVLAQCRAAFPALEFELKIIKTTGDKLQTASMAQEGQVLPKGLFTKELEVALLEGTADLAVHSLKDLPTELPAGLKLGAAGERADVRDVLLYRAESAKPGAARGFPPQLKINHLPAGAVVATSSTRRRAQLLEANPKLSVVEIRGNVATRVHKLAEKSELDATILALAGLTRLKFTFQSSGLLEGEGLPGGVLGSILDTHVMLPCVGQGAIGIEIREGDERVAEVCKALNHRDTQIAVTAERAFLAAMGGGCQSPVAAHAVVKGPEVVMQVLSFTHGPIQRANGARPVGQAAELGRELAAQLKPSR